MTAYIGPVGGLVPLKCPASLNLDVTRAQSLTTTTGGRRVAFQAPRSHRSWNVDTSAATPDEVTAVQALEASVYGPPPWHWIDPWAQVTNTLTPAASTFAAGTFWGGGGAYASDAPVDLGGGQVIRRSVLVPTPETAVAITGASSAGNYAPVPVVPGVPVTATIHAMVAVTGAWFRLTFRDADGADILPSHTAYRTQPVGVTERLSITATPPAGAASLRLYSLGFSRLAAPQVTWTSQAAPWAIGQGAAAVIVESVGATALRTVRNTRTQQLGANSYQIIEVG